MSNVIKSCVRKVLRKAGYELCRLPNQVVPEQRCISLGQLVSSNFGEITALEARFLADVIRSAPSDGPIIEIGTLFGWSTKVIMMAKPIGQPLITVDNFEWNPWGLSPAEHEWLTSRLLADGAENLNVRVVVSEKSQFFSEYDSGLPAVVFMDADHSFEGTKQDLEFARQEGARIICGHDYDEQKWPGVVQAVDECGGPRRRVGSLWVL